MKKLSLSGFCETRNWIYRNARAIDLAMFKYHFENGEKEAVLSALQCYQNDDGGFGKSIDPDNWNPSSSPYNTEIAIKMLREVGFIDVSHPIYKGIMRYLEDTEDKSENGWHFTIPTNDDYPHGAWWTYNPSDISQNVGTTASLCGFIIRYCSSAKSLYNTAQQYVSILTDRLETETNHGDMGVAGYCDLLMDLNVTNQENKILSEKVPLLVQNKIQSEKDNFMANPLEFVTSPQSEYYAANKLEVERALDLIIDSKPKGDVWGIPWEWYNEHTASKNFAISENWWKASKATDKLKQLRSFGRLEN